jgi:metallo-beta-lactamase family protein
VATLTFLGAARTVTGSKYLLEVDRHRLLVDCGQFQGLKELRRRNWGPLPVHPSSIESVILTHAHIDHSGLLPRLVANGFHGRIFCTAGTADLCSLVLPDAGRLQEEDARLANRHRFSRHAPALPLFTEADAQAALRQLEVVPFGEAVDVLPGVQAEFTHAGHLLGSAFVRVSRRNGQGKRILFGGDLGRYDRPILPDPSPAPDADILLVESTYGNRVHPDTDDAVLIERVLDDTYARHGRVIVPAFAVGRAEEVLYWIRTLETRGKIAAVPVYLDSPMAVEALSFYARHERELDPEVQKGAGAVEPYRPARFRAVASPRESKEVVAGRDPAIVISASGMATGGRVLHHLASCLPDPRHTILFVGYQAAGTRGRALVDGAKAVKIHGVMVPVAARIQKVDSMSAHADSKEILRWLGTFSRPPERTFLVHGEPVAQLALKDTIERTRWRCDEHTGHLDSPRDCASSSPGAD